MVAGSDINETPMRWLNVPFKNVLSGDAYEATNKSFVNSMYGGDAKLREPEANIVPRLGLVAPHHDFEAGINTARAIRQRGRQGLIPVKLWIIYPATETKHLYCDWNEPIECLSKMKGGCFWVQMDGESMCIPPGMPHATLTLVNSYLVGQQFTLENNRWLERQLDALHAEINADPDAAAHHTVQRYLSESLTEHLRRTTPDEGLVNCWIARLSVIRAAFDACPDLWAAIREAWRPFVSSRGCVFCQQLPKNGYCAITDEDHLEQHVPTGRGTFLLRLLTNEQSQLQSGDAVPNDLQKRRAELRTDDRYSDGDGDYLPRTKASYRGTKPRSKKRKIAHLR
jgi:hypothetical protein